MSGGCIYFVHRQVTDDRSPVRRMLLLCLAPVGAKCLCVKVIIRQLATRVFTFASPEIGKVTSHGKREFADLNKLWILMYRLSWIIQVANIIKKVPVKVKVNAGVS